MLFVLWSATGLICELPAGALADRMSRRLLLAVAALVRAVGFALWTAIPTFASFAIGFVLWGIGGSLQSGTFEALVYDELAGDGAEAAYGPLIGRAETGRLLASAAATAAAIPMVHAGGYLLVGWASVAVSVAEAAVAMSLPARARAEAVAASIGDLVRTLRAGLVEARVHPGVRGPLLLAAALPPLTVIDEYVPLLGHHYRLTTSLVPLLLLLITLSAAAGTWSGGRWWSAAPPRVALALGVAAIALGLGAGIGSRPGFAGVVICYGLLHFGMVSADIRLQHAITGPARATVTSVAEFGAELATIPLFLACGIAAGWLPVTGLVAALGLPLLLTAIAARRWLGSAVAAVDTVGR